MVAVAAAERLDIREMAGRAGTEKRQLWRRKPVRMEQAAQAGAEAAEFILAQRVVDQAAELDCLVLAQAAQAGQQALLLTLLETEREALADRLEKAMLVTKMI